MYDYKSQLNQMLPHREDDKTGEKMADEPKIVEADTVAELKRCSQYCRFHVVLLCVFSETAVCTAGCRLSNTLK